jgi:hypothetical protein
VAEHANIWHGFGSLDTLVRKNHVLDQWCADVGRDPAEIERSTSANDGPDKLGEQLVAIGERMITISTDGISGFDLGLVRDWLDFRDDQNRCSATRPGRTRWRTGHSAGGAGARPRN